MSESKLLPYQQEINKTINHIEKGGKIILLQRCVGNKMSESKKYYCEECKQELSITALRLQQMINASYVLHQQNRKLLEFVKDISCLSENNFTCDDVHKQKALQLLLEIGES